MTPRSIALVWFGLLALLCGQFILKGVGATALGIAMALIVAMTFMRLSRSPGLPAAFALATGFWLVILLGLGEMDPATRHDIPVAQHTTLP